MDAKKTGQLISESRKQHGMSQKDLADILNIFALVRYKHFDVHVFDEGKFLAPVVHGANTSRWTKD